MKGKEMIFILIAVLIGITDQFAGIFTTLLLDVFIGISSFFSIGLLLSAIFIGRPPEIE
jgi:hypothetical protein